VPIDRLINDLQPEEADLLRKAFDLALRSLHLVDRDDPLCELIAREVFKIGTNGTRDPREIAEVAVQRIGLP